MLSFEEYYAQYEAYHWIYFTKNGLCMEKDFDTYMLEQYEQYESEFDVMFTPKVAWPSPIDP